MNPAVWIFLAVLTGIAFLLAEVQFAFMLLLFEGLVEIPPIFIRLHNQGT
jgi:hypothetical protein